MGENETKEVMASANTSTGKVIRTSIGIGAAAVLFGFGAASVVGVVGGLLGLPMFTVGAYTGISFLTGVIVVGYTSAPRGKSSTAQVCGMIGMGAALIFGLKAINANLPDARFPERAPSALTEKLELLFNQICSDSRGRTEQTLTRKDGTTVTLTCNP